MSELKPCPLCGGNPELEEADINGFWRIRCENGDCVAGANWCYHYDREKLANAWNTRAEHTCQMKKARWDDGQCTWGVICSACCEKHEHEFEYSFNFCPTCGAKVVDDETL